jgi:hypothetical protein
MDEWTVLKAAVVVLVTMALVSLLRRVEEKFTQKAEARPGRRVRKAPSTYASGAATMARLASAPPEDDYWERRCVEHEHALKLLSLLLEKVKVMEKEGAPPEDIELTKRLMFGQLLLEYEYEKERKARETSPGQTGTERGAGSGDSGPTA